MATSTSSATFGLSAVFFGGINHDRLVTFTGASEIAGGQTGPIAAFPSITTRLSGAADVLASVGALDPTAGALTETWLAGS